MSHKCSTPNDNVHLYLNELSSRVVAESGIPTDRFHLGKLILQSFKDAPDFLMQVDAGTGEMETNSSVLERSIMCATSLRKMGLKEGDVIVLMAPNHVDVAIPLYAALYLGIIVSAVDRTLGVKELQATFEVTRPKLIFCQSDKATDIQLALNDLELEGDIVTFDKGDYLFSFSEFLDKYGQEADVVSFKPSNFNAENTTACLVATSGTTGLPKSAAVTHKNFAISGSYVWARYIDFPTPTKRTMICAPLQWLTALLQALVCPIFRVTRIQTSMTLTNEHAYFIINKYKPTFTVISPTMMTSLIKPGDRETCDFSCFEFIFMGGSAVPIELINNVMSAAMNAEAFNTFGMSELAGIAFLGVSEAREAVGRLVGSLQHRLINIETSEDILEPNTPGELWLKGPGIFKEYYNNPKATKETFDQGWFKTGDMFYRDERWNFYFVERIKLMLKYKSYQISPVEVEAVIRQHPEVLDVAVTGIPDPECGDLPVACVVLKNNNSVTPDEIKEIVKENLSDAKQLRGGVLFLSELPTTASTKIHRRKLKEIVMNMFKEGKLL